MNTPQRSLALTGQWLLLGLCCVAAAACGDETNGEQASSADTQTLEDSTSGDSSDVNALDDALHPPETVVGPNPDVGTREPPPPPSGDPDPITFHFVTGTGAVGEGVGEAVLYTEDELPNYLAIPGFQVDVKAQLTGIPTGTACQLLLDGTQINEWVVIEGMELQFQAVTMPLSPDAGYTVRVQATAGGVVHAAEKNVVVTDQPSPSDTQPNVSCDTLEQLLLGELAFAANGCVEDTDCAFTPAPTCDLGPHVTCHLIAHHATADISGVLTLFDTYQAPASGCSLMDCDCQATGAACFSGACKPVGY